MSPKKILRRPVPASLPDLGNDHPPLLRRLYAARGVTSEAELRYTLRELESPARLKGIDGAVDLIATAIREQQRVMILGDFDADGATSTAVAILGLSMFGLAQLDFR
ncbi:MAG: single-stranded-DNA-specific exonuclease RecJ, partial [Marinobacter sp.]|nr:single-stranded-DNA-specific exonuclease RecJ [Marinobacter sp.]